MRKGEGGGEGKEGTREEDENEVREGGGGVYDTEGKREGGRGGGVWTELG